MIALVSFILSGVSTLAQATGYFNSGSYCKHAYSAAYSRWILPNDYWYHQHPHATGKQLSHPLFFNKSYQWIVMPPHAKKEDEKNTDVVHYQSEDSIIFDANKKILSLLGTSVLVYDHMKLTADVVFLHLDTHTMYAQGSKDLHNQSIGNPVFTYKDVTKNKYGKAGATHTRTFFMEKIRYNINTKRALVDALLTKHEESIIKSKQVKKEDENTFYAKDVIYTTCARVHPHFYIRAERVKIIQDQQITTGPFRFYFDNVPTPLGCVFGTLFLEGKRVHGGIPPAIGESENGFYLRDGGYYINFNDYADLSMLGSIYSSGMAELKNDLRYKKRYLCSGDISYINNLTEQGKNWSLKWAHKTLKHGHRSFNANIDLHSKSYKTLEYEDKKRPKSLEQQSTASLSYQDQLIGFPYGLTARAEFKKNFRSNYKHWILPKGSLSSHAWRPFKMVRSQGGNRWFHTIQLKHTIDFENQFQNAKQDSNPLYHQAVATIPSTTPWNRYTTHGLQHTIPLSMQGKLYKYMNCKASLTYNEAWYWLKQGTKGPIRVPGLNRVYTWNFGAGLGSTLYHTHYFKEAESVQAFRIKTEPSVDFTYTPDFSKKYFQVVENAKGEKEKKYAFKGLRPGVDLSNRATSVLNCKLHNTVELKINKNNDPAQHAKEKKQTSYKIFLLKNLDFETKYDFKAEQFHLTDGIHMHIASEAKVGAVGKLGLNVTTNFDPYLSQIVETNGGQIKEEPINVFAWNHGGYLGKVKQTRFKVNIDFTHDSLQKEKKEKKLYDDHNDWNTMDDHKIDFETPWSFGSEFNVVYNRLYAYSSGNKKYNTEKYVTLNGSITLVKKWKISLCSTYNFTKSALEPSATEISIQRDLHCWQLSCQWHPLENPSKYDLSLGAKANVLKVLKLPRKRSYNKLN